MNRLSKTIAGIFVLLATAFTAAFGQSSGLPSGIPQPKLHLTPDSVTSTYIPQYGKFLWNDISGKGSHALYRSPIGPNYDEKGYKYVTGEASSMSRDAVYYPDVFLVVKSGASFDFSLAGLNIRQDSYNSLSISGGWLNTPLSGLYHYAYTEYGQASLFENGILKHAFTDTPYYKDMYLQMSGSTSKIYEILVFQNLTDSDRKKITSYLMSKYDLSPPIPTNGMTLWMKGNNGVTTNTSGNVTNIKDHSPLNNTFSGNKLTAGNNAVYWDGWDSYGWFNSSSLLINGYAAEFFAVVYSKDNQYFDRPMFTFSGTSFYQSTLSCYSSGGTTIKETFGLPSGQSVQMADTAAIPLENNFQLYNVSVGDTVWQAYLNRTLLRNMSVPYTSMNVNRFGFGTVGTGSSYSSKGGISELIVYNRKLSNTEREMVRNYLMAKYGLN